jgi:pseudaminic acid synthase
MFNIANRKISEYEPPYIIAELSANHNGSLDRAKLSIKTAKECGAHAVKIQTYNADTMTIDCDRSDFIIDGGLWDGYKLYDLYDQAHTPYEWHFDLYTYAREIGITLFSTPFDESAVDLLEELNTPAYKIASFELTDHSLIRYVAQKGKPMLMSTGMATEAEIAEALEAARSGGCKSILLFHCISSYPAPIEEASIKNILNLKNKFGVSVGLSDHTMGNTTAIASIALGACAIEKHFTLSRDDKGPDSEFSLEPAELKELVADTKNAWSALGGDTFIRPLSESKNRAFRRSIYFVSDIKKGETIKSSDIRRIRPGFGLSPKYFDSLIGRTVLKEIHRGDAVTWEAIGLDETKIKS